MMSTDPQTAIETARLLHDRLRGLFGTNRHCTNCSRFDGKAELCTLANTRPPAKVIVESCPAWDWDVPF